VAFINDLQNGNFENVINFIKDDIPFCVLFANSAFSLPDFRKRIIEFLPNDKNIQKDKLILLLNYDEGNYEDALDILKKLDLTELNYEECLLAMKVAQKKEAWDFLQIILSKLLQTNQNKRDQFYLKLQLFNATSHLEQYHKIISLGKEIIDDNFLQLLDPKNSESLIGQVVNAYLKRSENGEAEVFLEANPITNSTFEFKVAVEAEVYIQNAKPEKAIESIVKGVVAKERIYPEEYAKLFFSFIRIGNLMTFEATSLNIVALNTFVKLRDQERWYFIGEANELDATKISPENEKYHLFLNKNKGDQIVFGLNYGVPQKEHTVDIILPIEKYILWQSSFHFHSMTAEERLEGARIVRIADEDGSINMNILNNFLKDIYNSKNSFFDVYCSNLVPLAFLAVNQGGITNAIGRIQQEGKGFIRFSSGTLDELKTQQETARKILENKEPFYIDGTSAIVLSEIGYIDKIFKYIPNIKVPQSVINLLISVAGRFSMQPGSTGTLGYARGHAVFSSIEKEKAELVRNNFKNSIRLLESNPKNIKTISLANKLDSFYEQNIPAELCDGGIMAEKEDCPLLTEDYLLLKAKEIETGKKAPKYFSSLILLKELLDKNRITFNEYIDFFVYLSSYRFWFLSFNSDDILHSVIDDGKIRVVKPQNIAKLNFPLTLSSEYGVTFQNAFTVVAGFLIKMLDDDTIVADIAERIFIETISAFPTNKHRKLIGQMFLNVCRQIISKKRTSSMIDHQNKILNNKIERLSKATEIWNDGGHLWVPG
jgi:hypothetical protein